MIEDRPLDIVFGSAGSADLVHLRGEVDLTNAEDVRSALLAIESPALILDLSSVAFADSAGLRVVDEVGRTFRESARRLVVVAPAESRAGWTFRNAGFASELVVESVELATAHVEEAASDSSLAG